MVFWWNFKMTHFSHFDNDTICTTPAPIQTTYCVWIMRLLNELIDYFLHNDLIIIEIYLFLDKSHIFSWKKNQTFFLKWNIHYFYIGKIFHSWSPSNSLFYFHDIPGKLQCNFIISSSSIFFGELQQHMYILSKKLITQVLGNNVSKCHDKRLQI